MSRRTVELLLAQTIGAAAVVVLVLRPAGDPTCPTPAAPEAAAPVDAIAAPVEVPVAPSPWAGVRALGMVAIAEPQSLAVHDGEASTDVRLTPAGQACSEVNDGRCHAGCFEVMASGSKDDALSIEVAPVGDPNDIVAATLHVGPVATAGFCYGFPLGHSGEQAVHVRVKTTAPEGTLQVTAWRHPDEADEVDLVASLKLIPLGTPRAEVDAQRPDCRTTELGERDRCEVYGSIELPRSEQCEGGCSRWHFEFTNDVLTAQTIRRSVADVDPEFAGWFADEARIAAAALDERYGTPVVEDFAHWGEVDGPDAGHDYEPMVLQRRTWQAANERVEWELTGAPGHHPVIGLAIRVARPDHVEREPTRQP